MFKFLLLLCLIPLILVGCRACPEKAVLREGMHAYTETIRAQHLEWADKLTIDPATGKNHPDQITRLTPEQHRQAVATHDEYNALVEEDRAHDKETLFGFK